LVSPQWLLKSWPDNAHLIVILSRFEGGIVSFGGSEKGTIIGYKNIGKKPLSLIEEVYHVKGLNHNLISISQFFARGYDVSFKSDKCIVSFGDKTSFVSFWWNFLIF